MKPRALNRLLVPILIPVIGHWALIVGQAPSTERYARERVYDVEHIKLELRFDFQNRKVFGRVTHVLRPLHQPLKVIELDAANLTVKEVITERGERLRFSTDGEKLRISLNRPLLPDQRVRFTIRYEATPQRGLHFVLPDENDPLKPVQVWSLDETEQAHYWFPCYDYPNDKATSEVILHVPRNFTAISNGRLIKVWNNSKTGVRTFHWLQDKPHSTYLISVAVGEFVQVQDKPYDGIPIVYYVPKGTEAKAKVSLGRTTEMVKFFSEKIGYKYPWARYAQVCVREFGGGMEHTSATTLTEGALHDERAALDISSDGLVSHELAHQWFGDLLTCRDWAHIWLNEGFATYFTLLWTEHHQGKDAFQAAVMGTMQGALGADAREPRRPIVWQRYKNSWEMFGAHAYLKGAMVLHMLRYVLGDDLFWKGIKHYAHKHAFRCVQTDDFKIAMEEATGKDLSWFFDQWLYKAGYPEFEVRWQWDEEKRQVKLTVRQKQKVTEMTPLFKTPIDIAITTPSGTRMHRVFVEQAEHEFTFSADAKPLMVNFDPENWVLKTLDMPKSKEEWLYQARHAPWVAERLKAISELGKLKGDGEAAATLREVLMRDPFHQCRERAAAWLVEVDGSPQTRDALLQALNDKVSQVRRTAIRSLGERGFLKEPAIAKAIKDIAEHDPSYFAQAEALQLLVQNKVEGVDDLLVRAMTKDSHNEVIRSAALRGFAELGDVRGVYFAVNCLKDGRYVKLRQIAVQALARLAKKDDETKKMVRERLVALLQSPEPYARRNAISVLAELRDMETLTALQKVAETDPLPRLREAAKGVVERLQKTIATKRQPPAEGINLSGTWILTVKTPQGDQTIPLTLQQHPNGDLSGTINATSVQGTLSGFVSGTSVHFTLEVRAYGQAFRLEASGEIKGDKMSGTMKSPAFEEMQWQAMRK